MDSSGLASIFNADNIISTNRREMRSVIISPKEVEFQIIGEIIFHLLNQMRMWKINA